MSFSNRPLTKIHSRSHHLRRKRKTCIIRSVAASFKINQDSQKKQDGWNFDLRSFAFDCHSICLGLTFGFHFSLHDLDGCVKSSCSKDVNIFHITNLISLIPIRNFQIVTLVPELFNCLKRLFLVLRKITLGDTFEPSVHSFTATSPHHLQRHLRQAELVLAFQPKGNSKS